MAAKVGVILSGCGVYDGSEIHEAVITLLALERAGALPVCMAPDMEQMHVVNHLTGEEMSGEKRNVLIEAARIARGDIHDIKKVQADELDALIMPGGFGAAKNLSDYAVKGADCDVNEDVARLIRSMHGAKKPIAAVCIAPVLVSSILGDEKIPHKLTIGSDEARAKDVLGRVYEYFITNFADTEGNRGGEFFTPRSVVQTLVAMLEPEDGSKIFDPACGSGGMFVQAAEFTDDRDSLSFYGQESIDQTLRLCKMNLLMHDLQGDLKLGNSLLNDKHEGVEADYVIANPPFNVRSWGADEIPGDDPRLQVGSRRLQPTDSNANYMWMMHFLHHLGDGGTAGYVMANGSMTTSLTNEEETRKALVDEGFVDCIVQLPDKLFFGTGIPACLWFLSKNRDGSNGEQERSDRILFLDARDTGELVERTKRVLSEDEIGRLEEVYHRFRMSGEEVNEEPGFSAVAALEEVRSNDYKLTPGLYVGFEDDDGDRVPFEVKMPQLVDQLEDQFAESRRLQKEIRSNLQVVTEENAGNLPTDGKEGLG